MICPKCMVQMHQQVVDGKPQGGGFSREDEYQTWELKQCPACGRLVEEYYSAKVLKP